MNKLTKVFLSVRVLLLNFPSIRYAYRGVIDNQSNESIVIAFFPRTITGSDYGNIYFTDLNPELCPTSSFHHGIPKNGPCTIPAKTTAEIDYSTYTCGTKGHGFIISNYGEYHFNYSNFTPTRGSYYPYVKLIRESNESNIGLNDPRAGEITIYADK